MIFSDKFPDALSRPFERGRCFGVDPASIAVLAMAAGSTFMGAAGQAQQASAAAAQAQYQGQVQAQQANYMAQVARNNQIIQERNATLAEQQGAVAEQQQRTKTGLIIGAQRAALASQGGDVNSGSDVDILGDTARAGEMDALTVRSNAALKSYGFRLEGAAQGGQANLYDAAARNAMTTAGMTAANATSSLPFTIGSSLLSGASSVAGKYANWLRNDPGTPSGYQWSQPGNVSPLS